METISFLCLITFGIFGCYEPEQPDPEREQLLSEYKELDSKFMWYQAQLTGPATENELRKQIICNDFPVTYEQEYKPLMIKLEDTHETNHSTDLLNAFDSYKSEYNIQCN
ncbi:hypothetical protein ABD624_08150 [Avibacterium paragallinarum]